MIGNLMYGVVMKDWIRIQRKSYIKVDIRQGIWKEYKNTSLVIVPSQWHETFSFVTLEALSYGIPVMVSNKVGAKSIVANYDSSFIFNTRKDLKGILEKIMQNRAALVSYHNRILSLPWNYSMEVHSNEIERKIYGESL